MASLTAWAPWPRAGHEQAIRRAITPPAGPACTRAARWADLWADLSPGRTVREGGCADITGTRQT
jgi:hypothetical protein